MDKPPTQSNGTAQDERPMSHLDPRRFSSVTPPPMMEVYKGWWNYRTTYRQASDIEREYWEARRRE